MIGTGWVTGCAKELFTVGWVLCLVPPIGDIDEGILYVAHNGTYLELELGKTALLPIGFFDENQEHEFYIASNNTYIRLNLDV